jgi:hypothetical protein
LLTHTDLLPALAAETTCDWTPGGRNASQKQHRVNTVYKSFDKMAGAPPDINSILKMLGGETRPIYCFHTRQ